MIAIPWFILTQAQQLTGGGGGGEPCARTAASLHSSSYRLTSLAGPSFGSRPRGSAVRAQVVHHYTQELGNPC
jgi:hypothetical protein